MKTPKWTVLYNDNPTRDGYVTRSRRFYDSEDAAIDRYNQCIAEHRSPTKRPFDEAVDRPHLAYNTSEL